MKQQFRLAGLAEAWLPKPRQYRAELEAALKAVGDEEELVTLFIAVAGRIADGLVLVTDARLVLSRFRLFRVRTVVRSIAFGEIERVDYEDWGDYGREPFIRLTLVEGEAVVLTSTKTHAGRFRALADDLARRVGQG